MKENIKSIINEIHKMFISHRKLFMQQSQTRGLYVGQPQVLNYIQTHPGCTQTEIAAGLGVSPASIAFSTKRLQNSGFLQKKVNSQNMRCNTLYVTPEGIKALSDFQTSMDKVNLAMFADFTEEELNQLEIFLEKINHNIETILKEG